MYYLTFIIYFLLFVFREKISNKMKFIIGVIPVLAIIIFRYGVGADYFAYQNMYESLSPNASSVLMSDGERIEKGFLLILSLFKNIGFNYRMFLITLNILMTSVIGYWIYKESDNVEMSWLFYYSMFFFVWILSGLRQGLVMALATYLVFGSKKSNLFKSAGVILLSSIHFTALYYLVILIVKEIKFSKKSHLILLTISLMVTFLPLNIVFGFLSKLPMLSFLSRYSLATSIGFFDFQSAIRLLIYAGTIIFYDPIKERMKNSYLDVFLFGFYVYFGLKFSELIAARIFVYTFILGVIVFPHLYEVAKETFEYRKFSVVFPALVLLSSGFYFVKELNTMAKQAGMVTSSVYIPFTTKWNSDLSSFEKYDAFLLQRRDTVNQKQEQYESNDNLDDRLMAEYKEGNNHALVNYRVGDEVHSGIINQDGYWLLKGKYNPNLNYYGDVLLKRADYGLFGEIQPFDLKGEDRSSKELFAAVGAYEERVIEHSYTKEEIIEVDASVLPESLNNIFLNRDNIVGVRLSKISEPFVHYVAEVDYYYTRNENYFYFDENMNLILDFPVTTKSRYDHEGFLKIQTGDKEMIINAKGEIIWWR